MELKQRLVVAAELKYLQTLRQDPESLERYIKVTNPNKNGDAAVGACAVIDRAVSAARLPNIELREWVECYKSWPDYSGVRLYPVPAPKDFIGLAKFTRCAACYGEADFEQMWLEGEYAETRWGLIEHIIAWCEGGRNV